MADALRKGASMPERTVTLLESFPPIARLSKLQAVGSQR
jgi:hypothetical protein